MAGVAVGSAVACTGGGRRHRGPEQAVGDGPAGCGGRHGTGGGVGRRRGRGVRTGQGRPSAGWSGAVGVTPAILVIKVTWRSWKQFETKGKRN